MNPGYWANYRKTKPKDAAAGKKKCIQLMEAKNAKNKNNKPPAIIVVDKPGVAKKAGVAENPAVIVVDKAGVAVKPIVIPKPFRARESYAKRNRRRAEKTAQWRMDNGPRSKKWKKMRRAGPHMSKEQERTHDSSVSFNNKFPEYYHFKFSAPNTASEYTYVH